MPGSKQQRLSRDMILRVALEAVEEEGLDALSMRRLAQRLDVWPMSIYRYFRDKDELLDALADSAADGLSPPDRGRSWRSQMHRLLGEARGVLGQEAHDAPLRLPGLLKLSESGLSILAAAGFEEQQAARAWRALLAYTFGFGRTATEGTRATRVAIAALPDEDYPVLHGAATALAAALAADEEFDRGLEILLDGLASPGSPSRA